MTLGGIGAQRIKPGPSISQRAPQDVWRHTSMGASAPPGPRLPCESDATGRGDIRGRARAVAPDMAATSGS